MGADNQAEKVIDRIERMERMLDEIEQLKLALIRATAENAQLKAEVMELRSVLRRG